MSAFSFCYPLNDTNKSLFKIICPRCFFDSLSGITDKEFTIFHNGYTVRQGFCFFHIVRCQNNRNLPFERTDQIPQITSSKHIEPERRLSKE